MPTPIVVASWNIRILGKSFVDIKPTPGSRKRKAGADSPGLNVIAHFIASLGAQVVAIQEAVYSYAGALGVKLTTALNAMDHTANWTSAYVRAAPGGDKEAYLFLWRADRMHVLNVAAAPVIGSFVGDFPLNWSRRGGRSVGFMGFTLLDGSNPFIVANYHAPSQTPAPATGVDAITATAAQMLAFGAVNFTGRALCGDFNLDISAGTNLVDFYQPMMLATQTANATAAPTLLYTVDACPTPRPGAAAGYLAQNLDNIFGGPAAIFSTPLGGAVQNPITLAADPGLNALIESYLITRDSKSSVASGSLFATFCAIRTDVTDHAPLKATLTFP